MWIIKIGGSWLKNPNLKDLLFKIKKIRPEHIVIVTGGGVFADSIREVYKNTNMSESLGNKLALKSTEFFAYYLKELNKDLYLTNDFVEFKKDKINIWLPSKTLSQNNSFQNNWDSTSDSVAVWLGKKIKAKGIIFIKSWEKFNKKNKLSKLQNDNVIDKNVSNYLSGYSGLIKIVGLNIFKKLEQENNWSKFLKSLSDIEK